VLVNDLLFIARQGAGTAPLNLRPIDLSDLVERVAGDAKVIAYDKSIGITLAKGSARREKIQGDPARLRQLFLVLLDNAVRYSKSKGAIEVKVERSNGNVTVRVSDHGVGIAAEEIEGVFERFRRGGKAMEMNAEGLGLGLPLAKAIVEAHKGRIEMKSQIGKGTTVTVTLPAEAEGGEA
jgi:signal transduction histidine kinase